MSKGKNLYVCGISDRVSARELEDEFSCFGKISSVDLKLGFGFVEFDDEYDAEDALNKMNGKELDGRVLRIEYGRNRGGGGGSGYRGGGHRGAYDDRGRDRGSSSSEKIYVGGLPMDTRESDIDDLFGKYGRMVDVVLRTNLARPPAFAFLTFESSRDAEDAVKGRNDYMLNGSRLRVEFSKTDTGGGGRGRYNSRSRSRDRSRSRGRYRSRSGSFRSRSRDRRRRRSPSDSRDRKKDDSRSRTPSESRSPERKTEKKKKKAKKEKKDKHKEKESRSESQSRSRSRS